MICRHYLLFGMNGRWKRPETPDAFMWTFKICFVQLSIHIIIPFFKFPLSLIQFLSISKYIWTHNAFSAS